ncbi:MAG: hypothetical protein Q9221_007166 [Calogaya cf. arnoldii]
MRANEHTVYDQRSYACPPTQGLPVGYQKTPDQLAHTSNVHCHADTVYDLPPAQVSATKVRKDPIVTGFSPEEGRERTRVIIHLRSEYELALSAIERASLSFATRDCPAQLTSLYSTSAYLYAVLSEAPTFAATGSCSPHVLMCVRLQNDSGMTVHSIDVGYFRYISQHESGIVSTQAMLRELSSESTATCSSIARQEVTQQLSQSYTSPIGHFRNITSYPHRTRPYIHDSSPRYSPYNLSPTSFRRRSSTFSSETTNSSMQSTTQDPCWASSYAAINGSGKMKTSSTTLSPMFSLGVPATDTSSPGFIRTTELVKALQAKALKARNESEHVASPGDDFLDACPESSKYPAANLVINGDLDSMTQNWTPQENKVKRRLVQFWRSQTGKTLSTNFAAVENCGRRSGTISCIIWDRRDGSRLYVVTSVDIIHLLDFLVDCKPYVKDQKRWVKEQNRIRRNVDRFDKQTIKKDCPKTGALFDLVMGLPEPKPRHISKAVKVFPWTSLATAVMKVIEKYSPDYWDANNFIRDNPKLMDFIDNRNTQPKGLLKSKDRYDTDNKGSPPTPHSTPNSTHSRSQSSTYSTSGPSCNSSITSPNIRHTVHESQSTETIARQSIGLTSDPLQYASMLYPYSQPDMLGAHPTAHVSTVAGYPVRGSWDFSAVGTNHSPV